MKIFPTDQKWNELDISTRISFLFVVIIYLIVTTIGYFKPGPNEKDRQVYGWASSYYELGLIKTKGFDLSSKGILTGVKIGDCQAYVMGPPLFHIFLSGIFAIDGQAWQPLRIGNILYGYIYLYACLGLAIKFFKGIHRSWLLLFSITPMVLIFYVWNDARGTAMGIILLAYLCFTNFLETGKSKWVIYCGLLYTLAFFHDYITFAIFPAMFLQGLLHPGLTRTQRRLGLYLFCGFVALAGVLALIHIATLPNGLSWFFDRIAERFSSNRPQDIGGGSYTFKDFIMRQSVRFVTHFTPVSLILAGIAMWIGLRKLFERKIQLNLENNHTKVEPWTVVLVFFTWGVPPQLGMQLSIIHALMMYFFTAFFAFAPVVGLIAVSEKIKSSNLRKRLVIATLSIFLVFSIFRSIYNLSGGSLYDLVTGVKSEPIEIYSVDELQQLTCRSISNE